MDKLCFSIDEERYDDRHGHVLSLDGWYAHPERKVYEFELLGDGYDTVELPQTQRRERPDPYFPPGVSLPEEEASEIFFPDLQSGFRRY